MKYILILLCLAVIGFAVCIHIYTSNLEPQLVTDKPVLLTNPQNYQEYIQVQLSPTSITLPDQIYRIVFSNNITQLSYDVSWNQLEIDINKIKTLSDTISSDENIAWKQKPTYTTTIYKMIPEHNIWYIFLGIFLFGIFTSPIIYGFIRKPKTKSYPISIETNNQFKIQNKPPPPPRSTIVSNALKKALIAIDKTHKWFKDEDEANRELTSCLKAMGYDDATYHYYLGDGRTADVFFNQSIVEGKLNPTQSDIDRLMGQIIAYSKFPYDIHIVIYGNVDSNILTQLHEVIEKVPDKVFLTNLSYPNRRRHSNNIADDNE